MFQFNINGMPFPGMPGGFPFPPQQPPQAPPQPEVKRFQSNNVVDAEFEEIVEKKEE